MAMMLRKEMSRAVMRKGRERVYMYIFVSVSGVRSCVGVDVSEMACWNNGPRARDNRVNKVATPSLFHCSRRIFLSDGMGFALS